MKRSLCLLICSLGWYCTTAQGAFSPESASLDIMIGQMILTGIGDEPHIPKNAALLQAIKRGRVGGVLFFEKNIDPKHPKQVLLRTIKQLTAQALIPLFVSIDEEGGRVNRLKLKYGFPNTKSASVLGRINRLDTTRYYADQTASNLSQLGFNLNDAPVVDLAINPANPVIVKAGRSYSNDPAVVTKHAQAVIEEHHKYGVLTVLKHFPGHGSSQNDSHLGVADVSRTWQFSELMPYKALLDSGKVDGIMTAHIVNEHLDPQKLPATLSKVVISDILRGFLNYDGVVFTDDMQMHAITHQYGFEEAIKMAIEAGADVLLFSNNIPQSQRKTADEIHAVIKNYVKNGEISKERITKSYQRIMALKRKLVDTK